MSFGLIYLALIGANLYLSRVDKLQGDPEAERRPWLHKSGNWSVMCLLASFAIPLFIRVIGIDLDVVLIAVQLGALASFGLMARIAFLLVLKFLIKDDSRRVKWLLNWNKAALLYVVVSIVVNVPNLQT